MSFDQSPFAKSLYLSGTPRKSDLGANPRTPSSAPNSTRSTSHSLPASPSTPITPRTFNNSGSVFGSGGSSNNSTPGITSRTAATSTDLSSAYVRTPPPSSSYTPNAYRPSTPSSVPTGSWKHPSLSTIRKRTVNKELLVRQILINGVLLIIVYFASSWTSKLSSSSSTSEWAKYINYAVAGLQCLCAYNVIFGLFKLVRPEEKFDDLPVTPSQRKLLGLPASPKSSTSSPSPPKYLKSSPQTRVSPRPSPLARSASKSSGSPLYRSSPSPSKYGGVSTGSPASNYNTATTALGTSTTNKGSPISTVQKLGAATSNSTSSIAINNNTTTSTASTSSSVNNSNTTPINKLVSRSENTPPSPSPSANGSTPFTPTGRYMYMSDSPRKSSLRRL